MRYIQALSYIPLEHPDTALGVKVSAAARGARQRCTGPSVYIVTGVSGVAGT
jgi:hypothetical protein